MEVRAGLGDVAQGRDLEHHAVAVVLGHRGAAGVFLVWPGLDDAGFLVHRAAEEFARVAVGAADLGEDAQAFDFFGGEGLFVAAEVVVPAAGGDEAAFEGADGDADVFEFDGFLFTGEGALEGFHVLGDRFEHSDDVVGAGRRHFYARQDGAERLLLDVFGAAVPELIGEAGGVIDGGGVALAALPVVAGRGGFVVHAVVIEAVAGVAGNRLAHGEAGFVEQHAA